MTEKGFSAGRLAAALARVMLVLFDKGGSDEGNTSFSDQSYEHSYDGPDGCRRSGVGPTAMIGC